MRAVNGGKTYLDWLGPAGVRAGVVGELLALGGGEAGGSAGLECRGEIAVPPGLLLHYQAVLTVQL